MHSRQILLILYFFWLCWLFCFLNKHFYQLDKKQIRHLCITGGDDKYTPIAAASILAKVERDQYIHRLCEQQPILDEYYHLSSNKGYGTAQHMEGIRKYGIRPQHRKSFGICKQFAYKME